MSDKSNKKNNESSEEDVNKALRERVSQLLEENNALRKYQDKNIELSKENSLMRNHIKDCYSKDVNEPSEKDVNEMTYEEAEYERLNKNLKGRVIQLLDDNLALREYQVKNIELIKERSAMLKHITECESKNAKLVEMIRKFEEALKMLKK